VERMPPERRKPEILTLGDSVLPLSTLPTPRGKGRVGRAGRRTESALSQNGVVVVSGSDGISQWRGHWMNDSLWRGGAHRRMAPKAVSQELQEGICTDLSSPSLKCTNSLPSTFLNREE
jgi:hypothetical protein